MSGTAGGVLRAVRALASGRSAVRALARVGAAAFVLAFAALATPAASAQDFDHRYGEWHTLLARHVRWNAAGVASTVDYRGFASERDALDRVLGRLSAVRADAFERWTRDERLAFLINAYNAFTVELILTRYPEIGSIRDLGSIFQSPWKKRFFRLLGDERHLDEVEHEMIRAPGAYDDPRIHVAVVCASVGCPALRPEAFVAGSLDAQLDDSMRRFLSDRSRNRFDPKSRRLEVSKIFDWYAGDFGKGHGGIGSREALFARYAAQLADAPADRALVREGRAPIAFLDYDWSLNDRR